MQLASSSITRTIDQLCEWLCLVAMIKIIDAIDIVNDLLLIDDVNVGLNDVKYVNSVNDVNIVTNANNNYFYWVNDIKYVKNINDVNDVNDLLTIENLLYLLHFGALQEPSKATDQ